MTPACSAAIYRALGDLAKAVGHPTRLEILHILTSGEACVCHLTAILGKRQANVSQHLMVLREAGLVHDRRDGTIVYYRLKEERTLELLALLAEIARGTGGSHQLPDLPSIPVVGCPCPRCSGEAG